MTSIETLIWHCISHLTHFLPAVTSVDNLTIVCAVCLNYKLDMHWRPCVVLGDSRRPPSSTSTFDPWCRRSWVSVQVDSSICCWSYWTPHPHQHRSVIYLYCIIIISNILCVTVINVQYVTAIIHGLSLILIILLLHQTCHPHQYRSVILLSTLWLSESSLMTLLPITCITIKSFDNKWMRGTGMN